MSDEQETQAQVPAATATQAPPQDKIMAAFIDAQGEMDAVIKTRNAQHGKIANIDDIIIAIRPTLSKHGLGFSFNLITQPQHIFFRLILMHKSGQTIEWSDFSMPLTKQGCQDIGSVVTYGKRYQLAAAFGIPLEDEHDDDGARAQRSHNPPQSGSKATARKVATDAETLGENVANEIKRELDEIGATPDELRDAMKKGGKLPAVIVDGPPEDWPREWGERVRKWIDARKAKNAKAAEESAKEEGEAE